MSHTGGLRAIETALIYIEKQDEATAHDLLSVGAASPLKRDARY